MYELLAIGYLQGIVVFSFKANGAAPLCAYRPSAERSHAMSRIDLAVVRKLKDLLVQAIIEG